MVKVILYDVIIVKLERCEARTSFAKAWVVG